MISQIIECTPIKIPLKIIKNYHKNKKIRTKLLQLKIFVVSLYRLSKIII